jgi:hypothetical protein
MVSNASRIEQVTVDVEEDTQGRRHEASAAI